MAPFLLLTTLLTVADGGAPMAYGPEIAAAVADVAPVYAVPEALVRALIQEESDFDPLARSHAGAVGLMQVMPGTAARVGISEAQLTEPRANILAGTRLLAALLQHYRGDLVAALVAYNAGPRRRQDPLPRNGETPAYVLRVLRTYRGLSRAEGAAARRSPATPLSHPHR
jgi:soluble lytic murein transglycosylase-like protein